METNYKKGTPADFAISASNGRWCLSGHLQLINNCLLSATARNIKKLMVNMPPRHGKSEFISKYFPAWYLGNFPDHRIILSSYNASYAGEWGGYVRELIKEFGEEYFNIKINPKVSSARSFKILGHDGGMACAGFGGSLTGKGADLFIIDDPIKNNMEDHSETMREKMWDWYRATAYTRLEPGGIMIMIMTRWHEDDICGRIIKAEPDWEVLKLPAIAMDNDLLGRANGEALWTDRYSIEDLLDKKRVMGIYWFSAAYQQEPTPENGQVFNRKHFRYYTEDSEFYFLGSDTNRKTVAKSDCDCIISTDLAVTTNSSSDYTVFILAEITANKDVLIKEVWRDKIEGAGHEQKLKDFCSRYHPMAIGIESVSYQQTLLQKVMDAGLPVVKLLANKDKITRSLPIASRMESGKVFFRADAHWLDAFESELLSFPTGKHDDQVDAFAYIANLVDPISNAMPVSKRSNTTSNINLDKFSLN
jgi:predicted phage terminase large subunit-like protein